MRALLDNGADGDAVGHCQRPDANEAFRGQQELQWLGSRGWRLQSEF